MRRRTLLGAGMAGTATLACPSVVRAQAATTLRFVPYADLALLDPAVSAFVTRNHVLMVFDTLFGVDEAGAAQPQMLAGYATEPDGLTWTLTLRDGLRFHDGSPVLARDAVASIRRWWVSDSFGQALAAATDELSAPDDRTIRFRLRRRFHLLPDALAHPTNTMCAIMPERLASTPASSRLNEMVGSGPFRYLAAERVPGARNVYARYLTADLSRGFGYAGIVVAMAAGLQPLLVAPAAVLVAGVFVGADTMGRTLGVSSYIADLIVALALLCVLVGGLFVQYRPRIGRWRVGR